MASSQQYPFRQHPPKGIRKKHRCKLHPFKQHAFELHPFKLLHLHHRPLSLTTIRQLGKEAL
jgi:hypothetical protein